MELKTWPQISLFVVLVVLQLLASIDAGTDLAEDLPTVYEYYRPLEDGQPGLTAEVDGFKLNGKLIRIASGSLHYFRVHPGHWRDRLKRFRAAGLNAVDTYIPWNLHEPEKDLFDFGDQSQQYSFLLNVREFIRIAQEEDLLVILRPGPYICAEYEFGGLPSWLLRDPEMRVRSNYPGYIDRVKVYFDKLLPQVADLQWQNGGSIIAVQIENEFGGFGTEEKEHLESLKQILLDNGIKELLFTSDSPHLARDKGALPGVLQTANFRFTPSVQIDVLLELQPDKPVFVAEYWSGWFDYWLHPFHAHEYTFEFRNTLEVIFSKYNGSVNFYMFHGGTNYGFLNGANTFPGIFPFYRPTTSSYDYDAPLSESGRYTEKYRALREVIEEYKVADIHLPEIPDELPIVAYPNITWTEYLPFLDLVDQVPSSLRTVSAQPISMEELPINNESGQSFGFVVYRKNVVLENNTKINIGRVRDELSIIVDGERQTSSAPLVLTDLLTHFGHWLVDNQTFTLDLPSRAERTLDLLVENQGRVNFGGPSAFHQKKGLFNQTIRIDSEDTETWEIIPLEFKKEWLNSISGFKTVDSLKSIQGPILVQSKFTITDEPQDTFLDMSAWYKGNVFINGFNIGRYYKAGPTKTMYVAAPFLQKGTNTVTIFELFEAGEQIVFTAEENLGVDSPI